MTIFGATTGQGSGNAHATPDLTGWQSYQTKTNTFANCIKLFGVNGYPSLWSTFAGVPASFASNNGGKPILFLVPFDNVPTAAAFETLLATCPAGQKLGFIYQSEVENGPQMTGAQFVSDCHTISTNLNTALAYMAAHPVSGNIASFYTRSNFPFINSAYMAYYSANPGSTAFIPNAGDVDAYGADLYHKGPLTNNVCTSDSRFSSYVNAVHTKIGTNVAFAFTEYGIDAATISSDQARADLMASDYAAMTGANRPGSQGLLLWNYWFEVGNSGEQYLFDSTTPATTAEWRTFFSTMSANLIPSSTSGKLRIATSMHYFNGGIESDATHTAQQNANYLAQNVDAIVSQLAKLGSTNSNASYVPGMYSANSDLVLVPYGKSVENGLPLNYGFPEGYFAHTGVPGTSSNRINIFSNSIYLMQPDRAITFNDPRGFTSTSWANWRAKDGKQVIIDDAAGAGFNVWKGSYLDSLGGGPSGAVNPSTGAKYSNTAWLTLALTVGDAARAALVNTQTVLGNGLGDGVRFYSGSGPGTFQDLINHVDGGVAESWLRSSGDAIAGWPTVTEWQKDVQFIIDIEALNKMAWLVTNMWNTVNNTSINGPSPYTAAQVDQWRQYAAATFLIGKGQYAHFEFVPDNTSIKPYDEIRRNPVYQADLGAPLETATQTGSALNGAKFYRKAGVDTGAVVYGRRFQNGIALVNPSGTSYAKYVLDRPYQTLDGTSVQSAITVPAHTGIILLTRGGTDYTDAATARGVAVPSAVDVAAYKNLGGDLMATGVGKPSAAEVYTKAQTGITYLDRGTARGISQPSASDVAATVDLPINIKWGVTQGNLDDVPHTSAAKIQEQIISTAAQILPPGKAFIRTNIKVSGANLGVPFAQSSHDYDQLMYQFGKYGMQMVAQLKVSDVVPQDSTAGLPGWYQWIQSVAHRYSPAGSFGNGSTANVYGVNQTVSGYTPVTLYEIWNEPNSASGSQGDTSNGGIDADRAYDILYWASKALRDHGAAHGWWPYILAFGLGGSPPAPYVDFLAYWQTIVNSGAGANGKTYVVKGKTYGPNPHDFADAVSIHPYSSADPAATSGGGHPIKVAIPPMRSFMDAHGGAKTELYITEWGWRGHNLDNRYNDPLNPNVANVLWEDAAPIPINDDWTPIGTGAWLLTVTPDYPGRETQLGRRFAGQGTYKSVQILGSLTEFSSIQHTALFGSLGYPTAGGQPNAGTNIVYDINSGVLDAAINDAAVKVKAVTPVRIFMRLFWEFNLAGNLANPQNYTDAAGNAAPGTWADFINAWRRVWTIFMGNQAAYTALGIAGTPVQCSPDQVKWAYNPGSRRGGASGPLAASDPTLGYPGDSYVDWIWLDCYPNSPTNGGDLLDDFDIFMTHNVAATSGFTDFYSTFAPYGKPLGIGESSVHPVDDTVPYPAGNVSPLTRVRWWTLLLQEIQNYPLVRLFTAFDVNPNNDPRHWLTDQPSSTPNDSGAQAFAAYKTFALDPYMNPAATAGFTPGDGSQQAWEVGGMNVIRANPSWRIAGVHHYQIIDDNSGSTTQNLGLVYNPLAGTSPGPIPTSSWKALGRAMQANVVDDDVVTGRAAPSGNDIYTQAVVGTAYTDAATTSGKAAPSSVDAAAYNEIPFTTWILTRSVLAQIDALNPTTARATFDTATTYTIGDSRQAGYAVNTPTRSYKDFYQLYLDLTGVNYPGYTGPVLTRSAIPSTVGAVLYDNENWGDNPPSTPDDQQQDPATFMARFQAVAANASTYIGRSLKVLTAPARTLYLSSTRPGGLTPVCYVGSSGIGGETLTAAWERCNPAAAATGYDVFSIQSQAEQANPTNYLTMISDGRSAAQAAQSGIAVLGGLSTGLSQGELNGFDLYTAAIPVAGLVNGFWLNAAADATHAQYILDFLALLAPVVAGTASPSADEVFTPHTGSVYVDAAVVQGTAVPKGGANGTRDKAFTVDTSIALGSAQPFADEVFTDITGTEYIDVATSRGQTDATADDVSDFVDEATVGGVARPFASETYTPIIGTEYNDSDTTPGVGVPSADDSSDYVDADMATGATTVSASESYTQAVIGSEYDDEGTTRGVALPSATDDAHTVDDETATGQADISDDEVFTSATTTGTEYIDVSAVTGTAAPKTTAEENSFVDGSTAVGVAAPFDDDISTAPSPTAPGVPPIIEFSPLVSRGGSHPIVIAPAAPSGFIYLNPDRERNMIDLLDRLRPVGALMSITCGVKVNVKIPTTEPLATSEKFHMSRFVTGTDVVEWPPRTPKSGFFIEAGIEHEAHVLPGSGGELAPIFQTIEGVHAYDEQALADPSYGEATVSGNTPPFYDDALGPPYRHYASEHVGHYNRQMQLIFPFLQNVAASTDFTPDSAIASQTTPLITQVRSK